MKIQIPEIGNVIRLTSDWTFKLFVDGGNEKLIQHHGLFSSLGFKPGDWHWYFDHRGQSENVTLPTGTELKIDRIYIRCGAKEYSSLTFTLINPGQPGKKMKFWAKLCDVNNIEYENVKDTVLRHDSRPIKGAPFKSKSELVTKLNTSNTSTYWIEGHIGEQTISEIMIVCPITLRNGYYSQIGTQMIGLSIGHDSKKSFNIRVESTVNECISYNKTLGTAYFTTKTASVINTNSVFNTGPKHKTIPGTTNVELAFYKVDMT